MNVKDLIPHREPFLFVDDIIEITENKIVTKRKIDKDEFYFKGHYPTNPIMPGVLLCESVFQSGAVLLSNNLKDQNISDKVPVLTRIRDTKFKNMVKPGDEITVETKIDETLSNVYYMKGSIKNQDNKKILTVTYAVTLA